MVVMLVSALMVYGRLAVVSEIGVVRAAAVIALAFVAFLLGMRAQHRIETR